MCDGDDPRAGNSCKLLRHTSSFNGISTVETYSYNSDDLISRIDYTLNYIIDSIAGTVVVKYDQSKRISKITYSDDNYSTFEYQSNGTVVLETEYIKYDPNGDFYVNQFQYEFDDRGLLQKYTKGSYYKRYEYNADGNITRMFQKSAPPINEELVYENLSWDNNKTIDYQLTYVITYPFGKPKMHYQFAQKSKNNELHTKLYFPSGNTRDDFYEYTYNASGYPIKVTRDPFFLEVTHTVGCN
jgi:hypothetical protein